jgi:hypothetical protein
MAHTDDALEDDLTMAEGLEIIRSKGTSRPLWERPGAPGLPSRPAQGALSTAPAVTMCADQVDYAFQQVIGCLRQRKDAHAMQSSSDNFHGNVSVLQHHATETQLSEVQATASEQSNNIGEENRLSE